MKKEDLKKIRKKSIGYKFQHNPSFRKPTNSKNQNGESNKQEKLAPKDSKQNKLKVVNSNITTDKHFLVERFVLKERISTIKNIEECSEEAYQTICINLMLKNLFLKKIRLDPGFRIKVYSELNKKPDIIRKIYRDMLNFFESEDMFKNFSENLNTTKEDFNAYKMQINANVLEERQYNQILTSSFLKEEKKELWFYCLWRWYMDKGKVQEAVATESILIEFITNFYQGHYLFWKSNPYEKNRNATYFFLNGIREICEKINPLFLDFIEAQGRNLLFCEEIQKIIDNLNFKSLQDKINEVIDHFQDIIKTKLGPIEEYKVKGQIMTIGALIYFDNLNVQEKIDYLNNFYGIQEIICKITQYPDIYNKEYFLGDLPIWYDYGLLDNFKEIIKSRISNINNEVQEIKSNNDLIVTNFILIKYLCKILEQEGNYSDALQILYSNYNFIQTLQNDLQVNKKEFFNIIDINSSIQSDVLFLLGEIATKSKNSEIFSFVIRIFDIFIEIAENEQKKCQFKVIKSILYRMSCDYKKESEILKTISIDKKTLFKDKDSNLFALMDIIMPLKFLFSEEFNPEKANKHFFDQQSLFSFEKEPLLPRRHEKYALYADLRKKLFERTEDFNHLLYWDKNYELSCINLQCLQLQSLCCFKDAIKRFKELTDLITYANDSEQERMIMETIAFPYFYVNDFQNAKYYLEEALFYKPNDIYYNKYLVLINFLLDNLEEASKNLIKHYYLESLGLKIPLMSSIKGCYQSLVIWFKLSRFNSIVNKLINVDSFVKDFAKRISKVYCDIGYSLADLGFYQIAIDYFLKAYNYTEEKEFRGTILNNIGSVYSDMRELDRALNYFEQARNLNPKDYIIWYSIAKMYQFKVNYVKAKEIFDEASLFFKNINPTLSITMEMESALMDIYIKGVLNLNLVYDADALKHLKLAHQLVLNMNNLAHLKENTGIIFIELTNGFDCLFHNLISLSFLNVLKEKYPSQKRIPKKDLEILPIGIQRLWKGEHMSLENIRFLIIDLVKTVLPSNIRPFKECLPQNLDVKDLKIIQKFVELAKSPRNYGSHGGIIDNSTFMNILSDWIETFNKVLIVFDKIKQTK